MLIALEEHKVCEHPVSHFGTMWTNIKSRVAVNTLSTGAEVAQQQKIFSSISNKWKLVCCWADFHESTEPAENDCSRIKCKYFLTLVEQLPRLRAKDWPSKANDLEPKAKATYMVTWSRLSLRKSGHVLEDYNSERWSWRDVTWQTVPKAAVSHWQCMIVDGGKPFTSGQLLWRRG